MWPLPAAALPRPPALPEEGAGSGAAAPPGAAAPLEGQPALRPQGDALRTAVFLSGVGRDPTALMLSSPLRPLGGVLPLHADEFRDQKRQNCPPGHGGGRLDLSPHAL